MATEPMLVITAGHIQGHRIVKYFGIVTGEAILGANIFRDLFASITDIVGGRSSVYEKELNSAKDLAMQEMQWEAEALGANAIIAVDLDYETISMGKGGGMLMVSASGTAVLYE